LDLTTQKMTILCMFSFISVQTHIPEDHFWQMAVTMIKSPIFYCLKREGIKVTAFVIFQEKAKRSYSVVHYHDFIIQNEPLILCVELIFK